MHTPHYFVKRTGFSDPAVSGLYHNANTCMPLMWDSPPCTAAQLNKWTL